MIVTIDGPAGSGKSTVAKLLARRLGFRFLNTGATYRAVALAARRRGLSWDEPERLVELARRLSIELVGDRVLLDGEDVSDAIHLPETTAVTHYAANNPGVRACLVELQRRLAGGDDVVAEGRDQGTVVFPRAECKIFLTASAEDRARRRWQELQTRGESVTFDEVLQAQVVRDASDAGRAVGPLVAADDAQTVDTSGLSAEEVATRLEEIVRAQQRRAAAD